MDYILNYLVDPVEVNIKKLFKCHPDRFRPYLFNDKYIDLKLLKNDDTFIKQNNSSYWDMNYDNLINLLFEKIDDLKLLPFEKYSINDLIKESYDLSNDIIAKIHTIYQIVDVLIYQSKTISELFRVLSLLFINKESYDLYTVPVLIIIRIIFYVHYHLTIKYNNEQKINKLRQSVINKLVELKNSENDKLFFLNEELSDYIYFFQKMVNI